ncbi:MAG: nickel pincer cofactor biosynthesis protein LarB [Archangiaceae bacterium]|nr:nickel pincer cofactor biosynthesis protein LarB [Archangiaceae bacterium]
MDEASLRALLKGVSSRRTSISAAVAKLKDLPFAELGFATVDTHRALRLGFPEVVLGQWKTAEHCVAIAQKLAPTGLPVLVTRLQAEKVGPLADAFGKQGTWHQVARIFEVRGKKKLKAGRVAVVCAGTSDLPVAEEAVVTARAMGAEVQLITDVGVAGIHRLLKRRAELNRAHAIVAVAGMEGALPTAIGGLVGVPVIAVPTSVGYGASFGGLSALLGMLNSCAAGVAVVNIDNGFGAGFQSALISRRKRSP